MSGIEGPPLVFASKRDLWLEALIWVANLAVLFAAYRLWRVEESAAIRLGSAVLALVAVGSIAWLLYSIRYILTDADLVAVSGPFRWTVPLAAIEAVNPTRNPLSAPAASLDRLEVCYAGRRLGLLVSPADKEEFLRALRLRCPHLVEQGEGLVIR